MARNDGIDRTFARNQDLPTLDDVAKVQEHNEREKDSYSNQDIVTSQGISSLLSRYPFLLSADFRPRRHLPLRNEKRKLPFLILRTQKHPLRDHSRQRRRL